MYITYYKIIQYDAILYNTILYNGLQAAAPAALDPEAHRDASWAAVL